MLLLQVINDQIGPSKRDEELEEGEAHQAVSELKVENEYWIKNFYEPYRQKIGVTCKFKFTYKPFPHKDIEPLEIEPWLDDTFFMQLVFMSSWQGSSLIEAVYREAISPQSQLPEEAKNLVRKTCNYLCWIIAKELADVEKDISALAEANWTQTKAKIEKWKTLYFKKITISRFGFSDPTLASEMVKLFQNFFKVKKDLDSAIALRNNAGYSASQYKPGKDDKERPDLFRAFGKKELELRNLMAEKALDIGKICPPALFAIDSIQAAFEEPNISQISGIKLIHSYQETDLATEIMRVISIVANELGDQIDNLKSPGAAATIAKAGVLSHSSDNTFLGVDRMVAASCLPEKGVAGDVIDVLSGEPLLFKAIGIVFKKKLNRVLFHEPFLYEYKSLIDEAKSKFRLCILTHYLHALQTEKGIRIAESEQYALVIRVVQIVSAVISILAFMAAIVVSDGAVLPFGIAFMCSILASADGVLGLALFASMLLDAKFQDEGTQQQWKDAVAVLRLKDLDTIRNVGEILTRLSHERIEVSKQVIEFLFTLSGIKFEKPIFKRFGIPDEMHLLAKSVELDGLHQDLETIFYDVPFVARIISDTSSSALPQP